LRKGPLRKRFAFVAGNDGPGGSRRPGETVVAEKLSSRA
jgi:hypothetical protein